ncbi:PerC family transcriptional regulator [Salmonella enterica subsp. enterica serovar Newport]|nr:PerC family transcriptional regulator [Salmonella enterica subsp. enterica serovar Newport]MJR82329.1 PerC family transcriptional regulator [Salmonella enterica subsp. enterica serovar Newport]HAE2415108.1 PerC family transcriptional regulator [Salmonella enterica subsp. enterica serovar Newport]
MRCVFRMPEVIFPRAGRMKNVKIRRNSVNENKTPQSGVNDALALRLESEGLWRRAAQRWADVMMNTVSEDDLRVIRRRQKACIEKARLPVPEPLNCAAVLSGATGTLAGMGLQLGPGDPFRQPGSRKRNPRGAA